MIYNNPPYEEEIQFTCSECGKTFIQGNMQCLVMHYGKGCCHYGDKEVIGVSSTDVVKDKHYRKRGRELNEK